MLSNSQIEFISSKDYFLQKTETDKALNSLLYKIQESILGTWNSSDQWNIPSSASKIPSKISRGYNHKGFPYQVTDFPNVFEKNDVFSFRITIWYGNYFTISLHLTGKFVEFYLPHFETNVFSDTHLLLDKKIWETSRSGSETLALSNQTKEKAIAYSKKNKSIKLFREFNMNQINDLNRLTIECFTNWLGK